MAGFLIFNQAYVKQESAGPANIEATPTPEYSLLSVLNNNVQIKELSDAQFRDTANQKIPISKGTHVKTSLTGRAIIEFPNQTTTVVDKNSEFAVTEIGENKIKLMISSSVTGDGRPFRRFNRQACGQICYFIYKCIIQRRVFPKIEISSQNDFSSFSFSFSDVIK